MAGYKKIMLSLGFILILMLFMGIGVSATISANYAIPSVTPPTGHPRVLFRQTDISTISNNIYAAQNIEAKARLDWNISVQTDGDAEGGYKQTMLSYIESMAFDYAINGNVSNGTLSVSSILNYLDTYSLAGMSANDVTRFGTHIIYVASEIYDWCYPLMTSAQRNEVIAELEAIAALTEVGWPPTGMGPIVGHGSESQILRGMLAFAIAVYDERPDIWNVVGGRFYEEYVPPRNYLNTAHYNLQGDSYGLYRHQWDAWAYLLITGMGAPAPYSSTDDFYKTGYSMIYMRRPDGQYLRDGDTTNDTYSIWSFWAPSQQAYLMDSAIGNDPYLKDELFRQNKKLAGIYEVSPIIQFVFNDPNLDGKSIYNLPKSRFFEDPAGIMIARTSWQDGWDSNAVVAQMKIGGAVVNNHQHLDMGHFQLYYKGILVSDSGVYQGSQNDTSTGGTAYASKHFDMYQTKTIAHNCMLVFDPSEIQYSGSQFIQRRYNTIDGGQKAFFNANEPNYLSQIGHAATVLAHEIDPQDQISPTYTYIKGDLTTAYTNKVSDYKRSFMFLNLFDSDVPAALIVFDKITSSNANFKKTWLLHGVEEPTITGKQSIFRRTYSDDVGEYNGKMTVDTLLPASVNITKVGGTGNFSYVYDRDWPGYPLDNVTDEGQAWRLEVSPSVNSTTDYFLNVIQVSDNDKNNYLQPTTIENSVVCGMRIKDRIVAFSKNGASITSAFSFNAPNTGIVQYTVCDVNPGKWQVTVGANVQEVIASEDGGVLSFTAGTGAVSFEYIGAQSVTVTPPVLSDESYTYVRVDNIYRATSTNPIISSNNNPLMSAEDLAKCLGLKVRTTENTATFSDGIKSAKVVKGYNKLLVNDADITISEVAQIIDGILMIHPSAVVYYFGGTFEWEPLARTVYINSSTSSTDEMTLSYSTDGEIYTKIPDFLINKTEYNVVLPKNSMIAYLKLSSPTGSVVYKTKNNYENIGLIGGIGDQPFDFGSQYQFAMTRCSNNGAIPIKNERGQGIAIYTDSSNNVTTYKVNFSAVQPRLTEFTRSITDGQVTFIGGGAAQNDNGSIVDSRAQRSAQRIQAFGNISKELQGSSMFLLPWSNMFQSSSYAVNNPNSPFFSFRADTAGEIFVLIPNAATTSEYLSGWTVVNNGVNADNVISWTTPTGWSDYDNTNYFATAYKWICGNTASESGANLYRTETPGISGSVIKDVNAKTCNKLSYAYKKSFSANELVTVYNPGNITTSENSAIMGVFVKWDFDSQASNNLKLSYSADGINYTPISGFSESVFNYDVSLPDNSFYAYLNAEYPDGGVVEYKVLNSYRDVTYAPTSNSTALIGDFHNQPFGTNSMYQYKIPYYSFGGEIPIKIEEGIAKVNYIDNYGNTKEFTINFSAKQPRLTELTKYITDGNVTFVSGAAINNDNGTIIDSASPNNASRINAISNVSDTLVGGSMFVLPWSNMYASGSWARTNSTAEMFSFKADTDGDIYIMLISAATNPQYALWELVNNGVVGEGITKYSTARNFNKYTNTNYYALNYKWVCSNNSNESGNNLYRIKNPGIFGTITAGTHTKNSTELKYVYKKSFVAGELVQVYNPGIFTATEATALMPVVIIWD